MPEPGQEALVRLDLNNPVFQVHFPACLSCASPPAPAWCGASGSTRIKPAAWTPLRSARASGPPRPPIAGDNGAYGVATGAAGYLGHADFTMAQFGDGTAAIGVPAIGSELGIRLGSGQAIYWDLQITSAAGFTPASAQTFTMVAETIQN